MAKQTKNSENPAKLEIIFPSTYCGKLKGRINSASTNSPLFKVAAQIGATPLELIIDTGAAVSIIPSRYVNNRNITPTPVKLSTATGEGISTHGEANLELAIPLLRRSFTWTFVIAEVSQPLLGFDFLGHFGINIDCKNKKLVDSNTNTRANINTVDLSDTKLSPITINKLENTSEKIKDLFKTRPGVLTPLVHQKEVKTKIFHRINTAAASPTFSRPRRLQGMKHNAAKEHLEALQRQGIIQPSDSPWASPLHLVPKGEEE